MVKSKNLLLACGLCFVSNLASVSASDSMSAFEKKKADSLFSFSQTKDQSQNEFEQSKLAYLNAFNRVKEELAKKWDNPDLTGKTQWVQYTNNDTVKRTVDFETGEIVIEVLDKNLTEDEINKIIQLQIEELETQTTQPVSYTHLTLPTKRIV